MRPKAVRIGTIALETSRSLQMCSICIAGTQPTHCNERTVVLADCYPTIMTGFVGSEDPFGLL